MRPGRNDVKAFHGVMFRMDGPKADPEPLAAPQGDADPTNAEGGPGDQLLTDKQLQAMTKEKLVEIAGSLGVADISQTKPKLIEAILALQ
jgi:hypothetical protein